MTCLTDDLMQPGLTINILQSCPVVNGNIPVSAKNVSGVDGLGSFGLPSVIRDAEGNEAWYVTDTFGRVRQIEAFGKDKTSNTLEKYASLKYTYGKSMLYEIQRTTGADVQKYHFIYDDFGNTKFIGIGGDKWTVCVNPSKPSPCTLRFRSILLMESSR